jgi:HSP20 family protein
MFHNTIENLLAQAMTQAVGFDHAPAHVAVNITETADAFTLHLAAPGYQKEQFSIKTEPKHLFVKAKPLAKSEATAAERTPENATEHAADVATKTVAATKKWLRHEFSTAGFERKFQLPENVNVTGIVAHYENGILNVTLPKRTNDALLHREVSVA